MACNPGFSYDAAGNLLQDAAGNNYTYDAEGNVPQVTNTASGSIKYTYDGANHRLRVDTGSAYQEYGFNVGGQRVSTWNGTTNVQGKYYAGSQPIGYYEGGNTHFEHQDWLGTERIRTTYNGAVDARSSTLAFGDNWTMTGSETRTDQAAYASLDYDSATQNEHAQFRQLDTTHGRWFSPDPYDGSYDWSTPQSLNRYTYALNNPVSSTDPLGLTDCDDGTDSSDCGMGGDDGYNGYDYNGYGANNGSPNIFVTYGGSANVFASITDQLTFEVWSYLAAQLNSIQPGLFITFGVAPNNRQRLTCTGTAYVLAGNPANVGQTGFPNTTVTNGSAAVIPRQFTGQFAGGPFMRQIGASTFGTVTGPNGATESFNTITQAVGNAALGTALQAQNIIMGRDPGALVIEIVGGTNTWKNAAVTINMPALGQGCPAGTSIPAPPHS